MKTLDPDLLMRQLSGANSAIDIRNLLGEVMNSFGGQTVFANELVESIRAAEAGSTVKLNGLTSVMRAMLQHGYVGGDDETMDEESIKAQIADIIREERDDE